MIDLIIKDVEIEGIPSRVSIDKGKIIKIESRESLPKKEEDNKNPQAPTILDGKNCALLPAFVNGHTHSAMSLLRGYADDMPLFPWLSEKIWPAEALYQEEDFYWGYRLAFLEMIKSGTAFFNDMYFQPDIALKALKETGLRGAVNWVFLEAPGTDAAAGRKACEAWFDRLEETEISRFCGLAPHGIYTVSEETLRWVGDFARQRNLKVQIHLSETEKENADCQAAHGMSPTAWAAELGLLGPNLSVAHGLWLSDQDIELLGQHGCAVVHNPASNMKLSSGPAMDYKKLKDRGIPVILGTDGNSSGNNLNMMEQMKLASLLQKQHYRDPTRLTAGESFETATGNGADFWETGGGELKEGATADLMLIRLDRPDMQPCHNLLSNLVYSASGDAVDSLIVNGRLLMEHRRVAGESQILQEAAKRAEILRKAAP